MSASKTNRRKEIKDIYDVKHRYSLEQFNGDLGFELIGELGQTALSLGTHTVSSLKNILQGFFNSEINASEVEEAIRPVIQKIFSNVEFRNKLFSETMRDEKLVTPEVFRVEYTGNFFEPVEAMIWIVMENFILPFQKFLKLSYGINTTTVLQELNERLVKLFNLAELVGSFSDFVSARTESERTSK